MNMLHHPTKVTRTTPIMEHSLIEPFNERFLIRRLRKRQLQLYAVIKKWLVYHRTSNYQNGRLELGTRIVPRDAVLSPVQGVF